MLGALSLNLLVDPLWYGQGNRLTGRNDEFNERVPKANLFLQSQASYDCLILGSSTSTIVSPSLLAPHRCINLAFSAGGRWASSWPMPGGCVRRGRGPRSSSSGRTS